MTKLLTERETQLRAAKLLADTLCRTAIWNSEGSLCNWVAACPGTPGGGVTALNFDLYNGLAGTALFLAAASHVFRKEDYRSTCAGAIGAALIQASARHRNETNLSLFEGAIGLHLVRAVAERLASLKMAEREVQNGIESLARSLTQPHLLDVMGGNAGAICAILALSEFDQLLTTRLACQLGEQLLAVGMRINGGLAWDAERASRLAAQLPLCGFSHGAAGMGFALMRLFEHTGRYEFLIGARGAFHYEDTLFNARIRSWPDLRTDGSPASGALKSFDGWCHGSGGIAISRLFALKCDPHSRDDYVRTASIALQRTLDVLSHQLTIPQSDLSVCHGVAGLAEICQLGASVLGYPALSVAATRAANIISNRILSSEVSAEWPPEDFQNPGFMLGYSGIGYSLLRLSGARLPAVLSLFTEVEATQPESAFPS